MRKGNSLRAVFIFLSGILFPLLAGFIHTNQYSIIELLGLLLYFFFVFFLATIVSPVSLKITSRFLKKQQYAFVSQIWIATVNLIASFLLCSVMIYGWVNISNEEINATTFMQSCFIGSCLSLIYGLLSQIRNFSDRHLLDKKIVEQLDTEKTSAELTSLTNEVDLHFLFNSLNLLSHLISTDVPAAHLFNQKLAQVYKYILVNKNRELISLPNEIEFIQDYFYLLQLRHDGKLELDIRFDRTSYYTNMVLPCSLQQLVENAIKHNEFSRNNPLQIKIQLNGSYIKVMNNIQPKSVLSDSTRVGLRNLSERYMLVCNKDIVIEELKNYFIVKLPLINQ